MIRRHFEVGVFSYLAAELRSGDVCVFGSADYADYRQQLLNGSECEPLVSESCPNLGFSNTASGTVPIPVPTPPSGSNRAPTGRNSGTSSAPSGSATSQSVPPTAPAASTTPLFQPVQSLSGNGSSVSESGGSSGTCNSPSDRAADGSRCGGRAASQRPGGQ